MVHYLQDDGDYLGREVRQRLDEVVGLQLPDLDGPIDGPRGEQSEALK